MTIYRWWVWWVIPCHVGVGHPRILSSSPSVSLIPCWSFGPCGIWPFRSSCTFECGLVDMDGKLYLKKGIWYLRLLGWNPRKKSTTIFQNLLADGSVKLVYIYIYMYHIFYMVYKVYTIFVNLNHDLLRCVCVCGSSFHDLLLEVRWLPFKAQVWHLPRQSLIIGRHLREFVWCWGNQTFTAFRLPRKSGEARLVCSFNHREGYTVAWCKLCLEWQISVWNCMSEKT